MPEPYVSIKPADEDIPLTAATMLLTRDHVTIRLTDPETGAIVGRLRFTVIERDTDGLPVRLAREELRKDGS